MGTEVLWHLCPDHLTREQEIEQVLRNTSLIDITLGSWSNMANLAGGSLESWTPQSALCLLLDNCKNVV
ncbi:hypothetical protein Hamer_G002197 [Homarus americanus]|uniref:Uncharacterized protein n=1 Tax=Homarus americanus TaxID=6706 RepID=A0A8J5JVK4_HOMAM|nr:hypothetical protein Hamer_G002197 [Homarus americanus]